ncbi:MAG TPA: prolyl-tRNA synthetase associated domain-containing protein [Bacteroidales bacterium]|nr:MAG: Prolyl-tRNA editing protein ProX [Bacteroidetes bacterium ADurb.Bin041]HPW43944.1 prolyl-tRNA synthetase associated domain-containing protein [Bacteroidales bacterium]
MENKKEMVISVLKGLAIAYEIYEHPPAPTIEEAKKHWKFIEATHCKNIFFRNHKGNRHYLVIIEHTANLAIHDLEKRLRQGKLSFASPERMQKYLGISPGSVSPFGLINDKDNHVHIFLDENLKTASKISFHPNINTYSVIIAFKDFIRYLDWTGNSYEFLQLYD